MLKKWDDIPEIMKNEQVKKYYEILHNKKISLFLKRQFDIIFSIIGIIILLPIFIIVGILIKVDSKGPIFFKQQRVTSYGMKFNIIKFRTMVINAEKMGHQITTENDKRITRVGKILRKLKIDEFPQLFNILKGEMSFVGTRPEVEKYVNCYTDEMFATLLLPAGLTSIASIKFKEEFTLFSSEDNNIDEIYINNILPQKMYYNLYYIKNFKLINDLKIVLLTIFAVLH